MQFPLELSANSAYLRLLRTACAASTLAFAIAQAQFRYSGSDTVEPVVNLALLAKAEQKDIDFTKFRVTDMEKFVQSAHLIPLRALRYQENVKRVFFSR